MNSNPDHLAVKGLLVDDQTRCEHWHSVLDVIAIKMKCCGYFYACKDCHETMAGHEIEVWPHNEWQEQAILCGVCKNTLSIHEYLNCKNTCPRCHAAFNPGCRNHYQFYFEPMPVE